MKKIPTLFERNHDGDHLVRDEVTPGCEWVLAGEGVATRKRDGTCCLVKGGELFKRREVKKGKPEPKGFIAAGDRDKVTGKIQGWMPVTPEDKRHVEAWANEGPLRDLADGTYELVGPKVNGNPDINQWLTILPPTINMNGCSLNVICSSDPSS